MPSGHPHAHRGAAQFKFLRWSLYPLLALVVIWYVWWSGSELSSARHCQGAARASAAGDLGSRNDLLQNETRVPSVFTWHKHQTIDEPKLLRVYSTINPDWGKAFPRIQKALKAFKPTWVTWVDHMEDADVHILHVLGGGELLQMMHPNTVVIQHVTMCDLSASDLVDMLSAALLAVSFHDLDRYVAEHRPERQHEVRTLSMPWGVNVKQFPFHGGDVAKASPPYAVITGEVPEMESHREVANATFNAGLHLRHTGYRDHLGPDCYETVNLAPSEPEGPKGGGGRRAQQQEEGPQPAWRLDLSVLKRLSLPQMRTQPTTRKLVQDPAAPKPAPSPQQTPTLKPVCRNYKHLDYLNDSEFAALLRRASWVPVLRRFEGFEMMGVEALFSGTRPVVFDSDLRTQPYRWFKGHAAIVREDKWELLMSDKVTAQLTEVFRQPPRPISTEEYQQLVQRFSWEVLVPAFYDRIWYELQRRRSNKPQPLPPRLPMDLLPADSWQEATQKLHAACTKAEDTNLNQEGRDAAAACPPFAVVLAGKDRNAETCQDAALLAARLDGHIVTPTTARDPTFTACGNKTLLLLAPYLYPDIPLRAPTPANKNSSLLWAMDSWTPLAKNPPSASLILHRSYQTPKPVSKSRAAEFLLPPMSLDPRPPSPRPPIPDFSNFLLIVTPGSAPLAEAVIHYWARHPVHPLLYVLDPLSALLPTLTAYLTGTAGLPYNATNLVPLPPGPPSPTNISNLLTIGTHIHVVAPGAPAYPHLANLGHAVGALVVAPAAQPELFHHPTGTARGPHPTTSSLPQGGATNSTPSAAQPSSARKLHSGAQAATAASSAEELVALVRALAETPMPQRMLAGQEGQRRYLADAEAFEQRLLLLRYRVQSFAKTGCAQCMSQIRYG